MSPWRVLFSIDACSGLIPPVPRISVRFLSSWSLYVVSSMVSLVTSNHSTTTAWTSVPVSPARANPPWPQRHRDTELLDSTARPAQQAGRSAATDRVDEPAVWGIRFVDAIRY